MFLGYSTTQSAYFCLDRTTSRIYTSRHVVFHEYVYPFTLPNKLTTCSSNDDVAAETNSSTPSVTVVPIQPSSIPVCISPPIVSAQTDPLPETQALHAPASVTDTVSETAQQNQTSLSSAPPAAQAETVPTTTSAASAPTEALAQTQTLLPTRASTRQRKPVTKLNLSATVNPPLDIIPKSVAEALKDRHQPLCQLTPTLVSVGTHYLHSK